MNTPNPRQKSSPKTRRGDRAQGRGSATDPKEASSASHNISDSAGGQVPQPRFEESKAASDEAVPYQAQSDTADSNTPVDLPQELADHKERITDLKFYLSDNENEELQDIVGILSTHTLLYSFVRSLEFRGRQHEDDSSADRYIQSLLRGLIEHGQGSLEVLNIESDAWTGCATETHKLFIDLMTKSKIHTFSLVVHFPTFQYSLEFLGVLNGLRHLKLLDWSSKERVKADHVPLISALNTTDEDIFLKKLHLRGEAANKLDEYLELSGCRLKVSRLNNLYIEGEGGNLGAGLTRILNLGATESIKTLAWLPSKRLKTENREDYIRAFGNYELDNLKEMHPRTLILFIPSGKKNFSLDAALHILSSRFKIKTDNVQELIIGRRNHVKKYESLDSDEEDSQSGPDKIIEGLKDMFLKTNQDFTDLYNKDKFPGLKKVRLWLALSNCGKSSWDELEALHMGQKQSAHWVPSVEDDWVSSDDWPLAHESLPAVHKAVDKGMLSLKMMKPKAEVNMFYQMLD